MEVEPDNWDVIKLWEKFRSQMRYGGVGPAGLDMTVFFHELDRMKLPDDLYDDYVAKLLFIEGEALKWIYFNQ